MKKSILAFSMESMAAAPTADVACRSHDSWLAGVIKVATLFAPALMTWSIWAFVLTVNDAWSDSFSSYWTMSIALIFGSLLAGSTPCSAGVIVYPVTQLASLYPTPDSRDTSLLLQAVGLAAAAYTILIRRPQLLHGTGYLILFFTTLGGVGAIIGLVAALEREVANAVFTSAVFGFALAYAYSSEVAPPAAARALSPPTSPTAALTRDASAAVEPAGSHATRAVAEQAAHSDPVTALLACGCALVGGLLTATIGTGADIALFSFGCFGWNVRHPRLALGTHQLTAAAVVTMSIMSIFTSLVRSMTGGGFSSPTLLCWGAMVPVVVVGAPLGSMVLSPSASTWLRRLFYVLAVAQFAGYLAFTKLPPGGSNVWRLVAGGLAVEVVVIMWAYVRRQSQQPDAADGADAAATKSLV